MKSSASHPLDVVGLGYCAWDCLGIVDHIPEFDAPTVSLSDFAMSGGGPVSTALVTLARLGVRTGYLGALGDDDAGRHSQRAYQEEGVDISRLRVNPGTRSPVCICLIQAQTGRRAILCYRGTAGELALEPADRPYIASARLLHLDGHHLNAAVTAAQWIREAGGIVVLDANRPRPRLDELLRWVDVLITNSHFPGAYTGVNDLERAAHELLAARARLVVITLSEEGCLCFTREYHWRVPGFRVQVVDTTGAGDAFHGAFIYGLLRKWPMERTATFANAVAAMNCITLGGRAGLPRLLDVEAFLKSTGRW